MNGSERVVDGKAVRSCTLPASAAALVAKTHHPCDAATDAAMTNVCRCGSYARVTKAIRAL